MDCNELLSLQNGFVLQKNFFLTIYVSARNKMYFSFHISGNSSKLLRVSMKFVSWGGIDRGGGRLHLWLRLSGTTVAHELPEEGKWTYDLELGVRSHSP